LTLNKKSQTGYIAGMILFLFFIIVWLVALGGWIASYGASLAAGETGLMAFFYANLNVFVFIGLVGGLLFYASFGGRA